MARAPTDIRSLARSHTQIALKILAGIAKDGTSDSARVAAAVALLDRGWGKPTASVDPEGDNVVVTIRQFVRQLGEVREVKTIEHEQLLDNVDSDGELD
jgi:hypothetical protein